MIRGLRDYGVKEGFTHVTAVAGRALSRQGRKDRGERYDNVPNVVMFWDPWKVGGSLTFRQWPPWTYPRPSRDDAPQGLFGRLREGFVPNVEMWELGKEMDKDSSVVFRLGWVTREG